MIHTIQEYYFKAIPKMHFALVHEKSGDEEQCYKMLPEFGQGSLRQICFNNMFYVLIADYRLRNDFERISEIGQSYLEISQFETDSITYRIDGRKMAAVEKGLCCYINKSRRVKILCKAGVPIRFTKVIILREYFDTFLEKRYGNNYRNAEQVMFYLQGNPNQPEMNLIFQQIRRCNASGKARRLYLEGKILELLSLGVSSYEESKAKPAPPVRLDRIDLKGLKSVTDYMEKHIAEYPSVGTLAGVANMSTSRFQLAFQKQYGKTAYAYIKDLRMKHALLRLQDSDYSIGQIARTVGYGNAGHFAGIFKKCYGMTPSQYRRLQDIK